MTTVDEPLATQLDLRLMRQQITVMRAQAEVLRRAADGLREEEYAVPAEFVESIAFANEHAAELLNVLVQTAEADARWTV